MLAVLSPGQGSQKPGFLSGWLGLPGAEARLTWWSALSGVDLIHLGTEAGLRSWRPDPHWPQALALCLGPALALAPMALLFGNGGRQPFTAESMKIHVALAVLVTVVVPPRWLAVRIGAALTVVLLLGAFYLPSPIGSNALRLPMLFTIPVLAALVTFGRVRLVLLLVAVFWWQPFVVTGDLGRAGSPESRPAFHQPLVDELARREPGRV
ncbi:hypothetical protein AB0C29_37865, partial [Actinoplanes sp. NPDC048791]